MEVTLLFKVAFILLTICFIMAVFMEAFDRDWCFRLVLILAVATVATMLLGAICALGISASKEYESTGETYPCIMIDNEWYSISDDKVRVLYENEEGDIKSVNISKSETRIPLCEGETPYVELVDWKFLCFTYRSEICHIDIR